MEQWAHPGPGQIRQLLPTVEEAWNVLTAQGLTACDKFSNVVLVSGNEVKLESACSRLAEGSSSATEEAGYPFGTATL
eukprot:4777210-Amphidinium_carterae.1